MTAMPDEQYRMTRQREWNEAGRRYDSLAVGALADLMRQATDLIIEKAALLPGETVLDVGTGPGSPAIEAAARVGPGGKVTGIDFAPSMIEAARRRAEAGGIGSVEFLEMDAEHLSFDDGVFDAVISRYGFPHFTDAVLALKESLRVLRPGGRLAAAMHGSVPLNPYFTAPVSALKAFHDKPTAITDRGPFYFHEPALLQAAMLAAGFEAVTVLAYDTTVVIEDFDAYWQAQKEGGASIRRALDAVPDERRDEAEQAALASIGQYVSGNRGVFPAQIIIGSGRKSPGVQR